MELSVYPFDEEETILYRLSKELNIPFWLLALEEKKFTAVAMDEDKRVIRYRDRTEEVKNSREKTSLDYLRYHKDNPEVWEEVAANGMDVVQLRDRLKEEISLEKKQLAEIRRRTRILEMLTREKEVATSSWKIETHLMKYVLEEERSMGQILDDMELPESCLLAVCRQDYYRWGKKLSLFCKTRKKLDPHVLEIAERMGEIPRPGIYLYRSDGLSPIVLQREVENSGTVELEMEKREGDRGLVEGVMDALGMHRLRSTIDIGMMGHFFFRSMFIEVPLLQDACMNDPVFSFFFSINELRRSSLENNVPLVFRPFLVSFFGLVENANRTEDVTVRNLHRQSGFQVHITLHAPISQEKIGIFFYLMSRLMGRFQSHRDKWLEEYTQYLPALPEQLEKQKKDLIKNKKEDRPEYFDKYPRMFVTSYYSVVCQQKKQPVLFTQEDVDALPVDQRHRLFRFPLQTIADEFHPEYYYCPNDAFPHPGLKQMNLKGEDIFINVAPCCFGSPQDEKTEKMMKNIRTKDDEEEEGGGKKKNAMVKDTNNVITGKFIIKQPDQLGTIRPPSMERFLLALNPFPTYYRIGIEASPSSLLSCMITMRKLQGNPVRTDVTEIRRRMAKHAGCAEACLQENPGMEVEAIRRDIEDPVVYFDPRRFFRAVELFFGVRLIVFAKPPEMLLEDADLLFPDSMRSHYSDSRSLSLPVMVVFEHWGGKTNILAKLPYPHCELIGYKPSTETAMRVQMEPGPVFQVLDHLRFQFDGDTALFPLVRKRTWFGSKMVGQSTDSLGKVRVVYFRAGGIVLPAIVEPPLAVMDDVDHLPMPREFRPTPYRAVHTFLNRFDSWSKIVLPDKDGEVAYWTTTQRGVMWKNMDESTNVRFTFAIAIPPQSDRDIEPASPILSEGLASPFFVSDSEGLDIIRQEKIARCLYDLAIHLFSLFLQRHQIHAGAVDPDTLLDSFRRSHVLLDPAYAYPPLDRITPDSAKLFLHGTDHIVLPSEAFWKRVRYNLKWTLFHRPAALDSLSVAMPSFYQKITDFQSSAKYYYCHLERLDSVFRHAVGKRYEMESAPLEMLKKDRILWYHREQSPVPYPSLVYAFPTLSASLAAFLHYHRLGFIPEVAAVRDATTTFADITEASIYQWKEDDKKWELVHEVESSDQNLFLHTSDAVTRLLLPLQK